MGRLIGEFDDFIFNRGAIPGADSFDTTRVKRRPMEVLPDYLVRGRRGVRDPTGQLFHVERFTVVPI